VTKVPDQRSDGEQAQDQKNSIACVHDVGPQSRVDDLRLFGRDQFASSDSLLDYGLHPDPQRAKELFNERTQRVHFTSMQTDHLMLHQRLKDEIGMDAIEVVEDQAQEPLSS
jgi:hypothetical protein